ncbi:hypothetical protein FVE85_8545 [Porphyridium purpureum]|uniref:Uncharacterized protein n=1 Tax=Porphyridium purpureum TaxID=35688 RepID=A0A5J4YII4_PORPP|nr:hypothetical protein FVE85_8545 [Porphyridium purpureum]|eukprot:POR9626..scf292_37
MALSAKAQTALDATEQTALDATEQTALGTMEQTALGRRTEQTALGLSMRISHRRAGSSRREDHANGRRLFAARITLFLSRGCGHGSPRESELVTGEWWRKDAEQETATEL